VQYEPDYFVDVRKPLAKSGSASRRHPVHSPKLGKDNLLRTPKQSARITSGVARAYALIR
jgi:hypothetical protein